MVLHSWWNYRSSLKLFWQSPMSYPPPHPLVFTSSHDSLKLCNWLTLLGSEIICIVSTLSEFGLLNHSIHIYWSDNGIYMRKQPQTVQTVQTAYDWCWINPMTKFKKKCTYFYVYYYIYIFLLFYRLILFSYRLHCNTCSASIFTWWWSKTESLRVRQKEESLRILIRRIFCVSFRFF